jgi:hypothetical protein
MVFGSAVHLLRQLELLNHRTWQASATDAARWRLDGAERDAPLEIGAQFAFAIMSNLAREAMKHRLIMKLDF